MAPEPAETVRARFIRGRTAPGEPRYRCRIASVASCMDGPATRSPRSSAQLKLIARRVCRLHPLDADQAAAFLRASIGHRYAHLYTFLLASGFRLGEALALGWQDIDLKTGALTVRHTLEKLPVQPWRLTEPKSSKGRRTIPL